MPDPHNNAKMTGDMHPPEVESELPFEEGGSADTPGTGETARERGKSSEIGQEARPGRGIKKAGVLKDRDDRTSDGYGTAHESGEDTTGRRE